MADGGFEPKSIDDYRDIVKILKVKVIKQTKYIHQLEKKVRQFQSNDAKRETKFESVPMVDSSGLFNQMSRDFDTQNLKNKSIVMYLFKKNAEKMGLNLEGIFRYADYNSVGELDCDEFRSTLAKMSLGLSAKQISCLIYIFDEDCNGMITKNDYHNSIKAYVVSEEEKSRYYNNDCLLKIAELFSQKKVEVESFYEEMKKTQNQVDINVFGELVNKKFSKRLQEREIVGAFNQIDFELKGLLEKQSFLYSIRAYLAKPRDRDRSRTPPPKVYPTLPAQTVDRFNPSQSKFNKGKDKPTPSKTVQDFNSVSPSKQIDSKLADSIIQIAPILFKLKQQGNQTLQEVFTSILDHDFSTPITLNVFKRLVRGEDDRMGNKLALELFKEIDKQKKGSFKIPQLFEYYSEHQKNPSMLLKIIATHLQSKDMDCSKLMFMNSMPEDATTDRKQFMDLFSTQLRVQERVLDSLWKYFNKNGSDSVSVANIIKEVAVYEKQ